MEEEAVVGRLLRRAEIEGRSDDTEEVIRRRLEVTTSRRHRWWTTTWSADLLLQVEAMGEIEEITDRVIAALESTACSVIAPS